MFLYFLASVWLELVATKPLLGEGKVVPNKLILKGRPFDAIQDLKGNMAQL